MQITPEIVADFRAAYPLFSSLVDWPDSVVTPALCEGDAKTNGCLWGTFVLGDCSSRKRRGMYLYAAHLLVTTYPSGAGDSSEQSPYQRSKVQSKSVGDESISYAVAMPGSVGDEWLSSTQFGQQFLRMSKQFCVAYVG